MRGNELITKKFYNLIKIPQIDSDALGSDPFLLCLLISANMAIIIIMNKNIALLVLVALLTLRSNAFRSQMTASELALDEDFDYDEEVGSDLRN